MKIDLLMIVAPSLFVGVEYPHTWIRFTHSGRPSHPSYFLRFPFLGSWTPAGYSPAFPLSHLVRRFSARFPHVGGRMEIQN